MQGSRLLPHYKPRQGSGGWGKEVMWWFVAYGIDAAPVHIRSEDNEASDALTRTGEMSARELHAILRRWSSFAITPLPLAMRLRRSS
eukprot:COSAG02_NODE_42813_length_377_cov_0.585106_1_plen_87_part_00